MQQVNQISGFVIWLGILTFFSVMNETMFNVSLPDISAYFHITPSLANWTSTCFTLSFAIGVAVYGKISEYTGIRKLLLYGMLTYGFGSVMGLLCHAWYPAVLTARVFQGAGAAVVPSLIMLIIAKAVEPKKQGKAFGLIGSVVAFAEGIGPVIGGTISGHIHWSVLFALPLLSLLALPFILRKLPDEPLVKKTFDIVGAVLLTAGILSFALFTALYHWMVLAASILLFILLAYHIRKRQEPFLEPFLFRNRKYLTGVLIAALLLGTVAGFISAVPYLMRTVYHMPTGLIGGSILFPGTISVILFGMLGGILADRRGHLVTMLSGSGMIMASFLIICFYSDRTPWLIAGSMVLVFGGLSFVKTVISASVASSLKPDEAASGMGMLNFSCFLSEGIGIAGVGGLLTASWLDFPLIPSVTVQSANLFSNMMLIFMGLVTFGSILFVLSLSRNRK